MVLATAILSLVMLSQTSASAAGDVEALTRLETVWNDAHERGDAAPLENLWSSDLQIAVPRMAVMSGADALSFFRTGHMKFLQYRTSDLTVRVYENAAVVTGRLERTRALGDRTLEDDWRFTKVYVREKGAWKVVAFHASDAAQPVPAKP